MSDVLSLQMMMLLLILIGAALKKTGIVSAEGQKNINDLVIDLVLPCNIIKSFMIPCDRGMFRQFFEVLVISLAVQAVSVALGIVLYRKKETEQKVCLQYATFCSNAGFLGNPVAEEVFGAAGLAMASVFLIPMRIMMWSAGVALFTHSAEWKETLKKVVTHPCIIACAIGLLLMATQWQLPSVLAKTVTTVGNCNTALSMAVIGMILADADWKSLFDGQALRYSLLRLVLMPAVLYAVCLLLGLPALVTGVCVILTAMPAGASTSILATKYGCDELFATRLVVASTILSMVSIPIWNLILT